MLVFSAAAAVQAAALRIMVLASQQQLTNC